MYEPTTSNEHRQGKLSMADLSPIDPHELVAAGNLPQHIAVIMDGNGRWAVRQHKPRVWGHKKGVDSVRAVVEAAVEMRISALTLYAFSEENWQRPAREISAIMGLISKYLDLEIHKLRENNIRLQTIGELSRLPVETQRKVAYATEHLRACTGLTLTIALSYGGRTEIAGACRAIAHKVAKGELRWEDVDKELVNDHLLTRGLPDPDLLIRTSGEQRISNFLLWQMAYTELWFTPVPWPDFSKQNFYQAIAAYQLRARRFGKIEQQIRSLPPLGPGLLLASPDGCS
jgi:undecaprenyl diphosphate synthase